MQNRKSFSSQRGAALVVGLMLLLVVTLLAVTGMNTASTELIMAGNDQFRQNAFQAAEIGIEQGMLNGDFNPGTATEALYSDVVVAGSQGDTFTTTITPRPTPNSPMPAMWGRSWNSFSTFHFDVQSRGASGRRDGVTTHTQGMFVIAPFDPGTPAPLAGAGGL